MRIPSLAAALAIAVIAAGAYATWNQRRADPLPAGFARTNGRIEVERVDIAARHAGRLAEMRVREGDLVEAGAVVARMDVTELTAQLAAARASVLRAESSVAKAEADAAVRVAEHALTEVELARAEELERRNAGPRAEVDRRRAQHAVAEALIRSARAIVDDYRALRVVAEAQVAQIEATIADMRLTAPVAGRIEYRLAQAGEVLPAGGRVATLLDLSDASMTIFLPTSSAGRAAFGGEARIVLDAAPGYVIPASVSFVAAEAQFTPKTVETANEREKLMYRVKLRIDPALLATYRDHVKAGLSGNAYVRLDDAARWPPSLEVRLPEPRRP